MCPCDADAMTVEHLLQRCQLHDALRKDWVLDVVVQVLDEAGDERRRSMVLEQVVIIIIIMI